MTQDQSPAGSAPTMVVRPHRIVIYASIATAVIVGTMLAVGILLRNSDAGVAFRPADQVGLIGIGLLFGVLIMVAAARPKLKVDETGIAARNIVGHRNYDWSVIHRVAFHEGAQWPTLELADDESYPLMAIQAMDRERALTAIQQLRALMDRYAVNRPEPTEQARAAAQAEAERALAARPLGRLEIQDLHRLAKKANRPQ
jgi:hypothetical protein